MVHRAPADPTVLNSNLDRYPDKGWGGNSFLNRDSRRAQDPNRECSRWHPLRDGGHHLCDDLSSTQSGHPLSISGAH